jgi:hypothetical protein
MKWFWERMMEHKTLIAELTGWSPVHNTYRFEAAIADAFDKLAAERVTTDGKEQSKDQGLDMST